MTSFLRCGYLILVISIFFTTSHALQGGGPPPKTQPAAQGAGPSTGRQPRGGKLRRRRKTRTTAPTPEAPKPLNATWTIKTRPPSSNIILDGKDLGPTKPDGSMELKLSAQSHRLVVRAPGHHDDQRDILVVAGRDESIEIPLIAKPGTLTIIPSELGATIKINTVGTFAEQVINHTVPAGVYQVEVSKPGFQNERRNIEVPPDQLEERAVPLKLLPTEEALAQAEQALQGKDYKTVLEICQSILKIKPDNMRANVLAGYSHYYTARFDQSLVYLLKALDGNAQIEIPINFYQQVPAGDELLSGRLILRRGNFGFRANERRDFDLSVTANKIRDLAPKPQKGGRVYMVIAIYQNGSKKEKEEKFNYHPAAAVVNRERKPTVECNNCERELQTILQLIQRVRQ